MTEKPSAMPIPIPPLALADLVAAYAAAQDAARFYNALVALTVKMLRLDPALANTLDLERGVIVPFVAPIEPTALEAAS